MESVHQIPFNKLSTWCSSVKGHTSPDLGAAELRQKLNQLGIESIEIYASVIPGQTYSITAVPTKYIKGERNGNYIILDPFIGEFKDYNAQVPDILVSDIEQVYNQNYYSRIDDTNNLR